ncbi:MAG TPA: ATP-binding protein [Dongiaceae bacterium]|nr:ATP-binding protein [Dongiaceae bacterium]
MIRHSIFTKIFLWFWAALILVSGSVIFITLLSGSQPLGQRWLAHSLDFYASTAVDLYTHGGKPALDRYLDDIHNSVGITATLLDPSERDLSGRGVPPEARRVFDAARVAGQSRFYTRLRWTGASLVATPQGYYYFVAEVRPVRGTFAEPGFRAALLKFITAMLAAGLLSFLLARHFAKPIRTLQSAANRLADGDLTVRTTPYLPNRQDELSELAHDFDRMAARVQSLIKGRQELLGDISHELRSPLTRMNVSLELVRRGDPSALARMQGEIERLEALIAQILTLTRLDLREEQQLNQQVDLRELLESVAKDARFEGGPQKKDVVIAASSPVAVTGDPALLRSCLDNVLRNAIRHTPENSFVEATLRTMPNGGGRPSAQVVIRDYGPGVPAEALERIFEPFFRVSDARDRSTGGSGLGLSIAQRVAALHDGSIKAENVPGGGLAVTLIFPVVPSYPAAN